MKQIFVKKTSQGTLSCNVEITQEEWKHILLNPDVTTANYKQALMAFYNEPQHQSSCKMLSLKYYGDASGTQKFNSWITSFGKAVVKHLNRFQIIDAEGKERFWHVAMSAGAENEDGLFVTSLRPELVAAIEEIGWGRNYWLVGFTYDGNKSQLERFFKEGIWESIYIDAKANDQKLLALAKTIKKGDVIILKAALTKGKGHKVSFLRVSGVGIVEEDVVCSQKEGYTQCACPVRYVSTDKKEFIGSNFGARRATIHQADAKVQAIIDYAESLIKQNSMKTNLPYQAYINLLQETHNLVLTGAPGTGKTFMAQAIAKEMGCGDEEMYFVQFHPSYDYTDFVEGLRPVVKDDGQMGFERKDGVFKEFCKKAIKNLKDAEKSLESLAKELSWEEKLQQFVEEAVEKGTSFQLTNGNRFTIQEMRDRSIIMHNEVNEKTAQVPVNADDVIELLTNDAPLNMVKDIRIFYHRKNNLQSDSYALIIAKKIREMKNFTTSSHAEKIERKPFVFIIDEINRGEASKIFGELFYAIDPGYRGKEKGRVKTQYQNLVVESDPFAKGFYVPENVYILATMNDIDRSVECMDFAMRRRFTWKEIKPSDTASMLNPLACANDAKAAMMRLNDAIAKTEGLGTAFQVGPSYFLKLKDNGGNFDKLWEMNIEPLLREYLRGFRKADKTLKQFQNAYFNTQANDEDSSTNEQTDED